MKAVIFSIGFVFCLASSFADAKPAKKRKGCSKSEICVGQSLGPRFESIDNEILILQKQAAESSNNTVTEKTEKKTVQTKKTIKRKTTKNPKKKVFTRRVLRKKQETKPEIMTAIAPPPAEEKPKNFKISPVLGCGHFVISGKLLENSFTNSLEHTPGYVGGLMAEFRKERSLFGVELGLMYVQSGVLGNRNGVLTANGRLDYIYNDYLFVPLNAKLYPVRGESFELFLKAGVMAGTLLASDIGTTTGSNVSSERDASAFFKSSDIEGNVGIGARYLISPTFSIGLEISYTRSFTDISDTSSLAGLTGGVATGTGSDAFNEGVIGLLSLGIGL